MLEKLYPAAVLIVENKNTSISYVIRHLGIGYNEASYIIDELEKLKVIGPFLGSSPRLLLVKTIEELNKIVPPPENGETKTV